MALLTVDTLTEGTMTSYTPQAVSSSDTFPNDGQTIFVVSNGSGSTLTITAVVQTTDFKTPGVGVTKRANHTLAVANGAVAKGGPFSKSVYNNSSGLMTLQFDQTSSVTIEFFKVPSPQEYAR